MNSAGAKKKTVVLGASANPARYSYLCLQRLRALGHPIVAVGRRAAKAGEISIDKGEVPADDVDTVTLYLNASHQQQYYDYILSLKPKRIIFNPGAENDELAALARENNIVPLEACTLVMLNTGQY